MGVLCHSIQDTQPCQMTQILVVWRLHKKQDLFYFLMAILYIKHTASKSAVKYKTSCSKQSRPFIFGSHSLSSLRVTNRKVEHILKLLCRRQHMFYQYLMDLSTSHHSLLKLLSVYFSNLMRADS